MNDDDSSQMASMLENQGYLPSSVEDASVILLNTCSVRAKPEDKAYSKLGQLREIKDARPDAIIGVTGCMAQKDAEIIRRRAPHVDLVVGPGQIDKIPSLIDRIRSDRKPQIEVSLPSRKDRLDKSTPVRVMSGKRKLKSFVSISYGCDKFCTFCIVPITRGKERSRPFREIIEEIRGLADSGVKEVTLLGQTVNSYGKFLDEPCSFAELLEKVNEIDGIERIRYTSPYPKDFHDDVIAAIASLPKVMPQVHMPVQVGDDNLLKRMKRGYTLDQYREIVRKLRAAAPNVALTTDLMLGFPGETEQEFEHTMDFVREIRYDSAYMFAYSPREGTKAAEYGDQLSREEKIRRLEALIALQNQITIEINQSESGGIYPVLVEARSPKNNRKWTGLTPQGKTVNFEAEEDLVGQTVLVRAVSGHLWGYVGEILTAKDKSEFELVCAVA
jgi:tRNA-2-methylthio-N6-dimethylallyladenosine synthase